MPGIRTPGFRMTIGGRSFNEEPKKNHVAQITVEQTADGASSFEVILDDSANIYSQQDPIKEGESCSISLGFAEKGGPKPVFSGTVSSVKIKRKESGRKLIYVKGYDPLYGLTTGRKRRSWEEIKDSDLVSEILSDHGIKIAEIEDTGIILPFVVQNNLNDLNFLQERAKHNGYELKYETNPERDGAVFAKPKRSDGGAILRWDAAKEDGATALLQRCDFDTSTINQPNAVVVRWYDPDAAEPIIGKAADVTGDKMGGSIRQGNTSHTIQISDIPVYSAEEAERVAQSILDQRAGEYLTGVGQCIGCPDVLCGHKVKIEDVGPDFTGDYYVTECKHVFKVGGGRGFGYWTSFKVSRTGSH